MPDYSGISVRFKDIYTIDGSPVAVNYSDKPDPDGYNKKGFVCVHIQRAKKEDRDSYCHTKAFYLPAGHGIKEICKIQR